jgi:hypothetical protein
MKPAWGPDARYWSTKSTFIFGGADAPGPEPAWSARSLPPHPPIATAIVSRVAQAADLLIVPIVIVILRST